MKSIIFICLMAASTWVNADGGKVKNPVIIDEENPCVLAVPGIDEQKCVEVEASEQSGIITLLCNVKLICIDTD